MTLLRYEAAGGAPPPLSELLVVGDDGSVESVVRHGWPARGPANEVGVYGLPADMDRAADIAALVPEPLPPATDLQAGAPSEGIVVDERQVAWDPADVPPSLAPLAARMRELAAEARAHPAAALAAVLEPVDGAVELRLVAWGTRAIRFGAVTLRARIAPPGDPPSDARALLRVDPVALDDAWHEMAPGDDARWPLRFLAVPRATTLHALISVMWSLGDEPAQEGWLRPTPLPLP